ncbi:MAG: radA [Clostridiales bacterium]|jgi:DNA repair protein RadA/Sms|nr:radA [Clostridiales bacterium]
MAKLKTMYICNQCGYETARWMGQCTECKEWNTLEEKIYDVKKEKASVKSSISRANLQRLTDVETKSSDRILTSLNEFNRAMGGGIVKDSITILTAKPGAGKSTLLLQVANDLANRGMKVLYASGEESESQIKSRALRILDTISDNVWVVSDNNLDNVLAIINEIQPGLIIVDSIQTFIMEEFSPSRAGSPSQTMGCANGLLQIAKNPNSPKAVIIVGQMTKDDELAGVRALEHLVDAVLVIDADSGEELRTLTVDKNRFGSAGEIGFFNITEKGMISIDNPSEYFMTSRENNSQISGAALAVIKEGTRSIIVEIESLVSKSFTPYPSRIAECLKREQLNTLISVLEQRGNIGLYDKNVVVKTTGGIRLKENAANLATIMSIVSSALNKGIPSDTVFIADVGLTGELKKVPFTESRIKELDRMGFKKVIIAKGTLARAIKTENIKIVECNTLLEVIKMM